MYIFAIIFLCICPCWSQFQIGIVDPQTYAALQPLVPINSNIKLTSISIPTDINSNSDSYINTKNTLSQYHAIIGQFHYAAAIICQSLLIPYFIIDEQIDRGTNTGALLDISLNKRMLGGALNYTLSKFNLLQNLQFLSDSSTNAMEILWSLTAGNVKQCNLNPNDTDATITACFQNLVNVPGRAFVIVTNDNNVGLAERIIKQSLYRSLPYNSFIFFPMLNTTKLLIDYHYIGGVLYTMKQTGIDSETETTLPISYAKRALTYINDTIIANKWTASFNRSYTLLILQQPVFKPSGESNFYFFYWKLLQDMTTFEPTLVTFINYNTSFSYITSISDPTNLGVIDSINVLFIYDPIFVQIGSASDKSETYSGFLIDSLNLVLPPMKIAYNLKRSEISISIGRLTKNGYTGLLREMIESNYDMIGTPIPYINAYLNQFAYSQKIFTVPFSVLMKKPVKSLNYFRLSEPYTPIVWITIIVTIVFLSVILWIINLISPNIGDSTEKLTINNSVFMVIGSFLIAKLLVKPNMISTQIFYLLIWLVTLLFISSYVANLCVTIAFQKAESTQFSSYAQLFSQRPFEWAFLTNSFLYDMIMMDIDNNVSSLIVQMFNYTNTTYPTKYILNDTVDVPTFLMNNPNVAILNDAYHNNFYSLKNCSLITTNDNSFNLSLAYIMKQNFKYKTQLYQQIITLQTRGTIDFNENRYFLVGHCPTTSSIVSSVLPLDINDMAGLFLLIIIGIVASFPAALIEYLLNKSKLQCQRRLTSNSLKFGQIYRAKVTALDRNGVTVDIGRLSLFSANSEGRYFYVPKRYLGTKKKADKESIAPTDQGIMIGTKLLLKYMGNNPVDSKRIFTQVQKKK